jgi:hypothetical protein
MNGTPDPAVFRPRWVLSAVMAVAAVLWLGVLGYLFTYDGVPLKMTLTSGLFAAFFALAALYYGRSAIWFDRGTVVYRGMLRTRRFAFEEIRKLDVLRGPLTVYSIRTRQQIAHFTSLFSQHKVLAQLLVQRAGLEPLRV